MRLYCFNPFRSYGRRIKYNWIYENLHSEMKIYIKQFSIDEIATRSSAQGQIGYYIVTVASTDLYTFYEYSLVLTKY